jgi:DNA-binding transcriptional regulator YiaG
MAATKAEVAQTIQHYEEQFEAIHANPTTQSIQKLIPEVLDVLGLNPSQLAVRLNVSPATVARWIAGPTIPHLREIRAMRELVRSHFAGSAFGVLVSSLNGRLGRKGSLF